MVCYLPILQYAWHMYRNFSTVTSNIIAAMISLQWPHNDDDVVSNNQPYDCLLNRLFRRRTKKTSKLRVTGLCVGNSPVTGEIPAQRVSNAENVSIWWRHHGKPSTWWVPLGKFDKHISAFNHPNAKMVHVVESLPYENKDPHKVECRYNVVQCNMMLYTVLQLLRQYIIRICIHNGHPIIRPHGRVVGCLLWGIWRKLTAL